MTLNAANLVVLAKTVDPKEAGLGIVLTANYAYKFVPLALIFVMVYNWSVFNVRFVLMRAIALWIKWVISAVWCVIQPKIFLRKKSGYHWLRPRLIGYSVVVLVMMVTFVYSLAARVPLSIDAIRDRNQLYRENSDGFN